MIYSNIYSPNYKVSTSFHVRDEVFDSQSESESVLLSISNPAAISLGLKGTN